jgi:hypothetical protein
MLSFFKKNHPSTPIPEIQLESLSKGEFEKNFFSPKKPALIKGGIKDWPLFRNWSIDYISKLAGNEPCTIVDDSRPAASKTRSTLKQYFLDGGNKATLSLTDYKKGAKPKFFKDLEIPNKLYGFSDIYRYFFFHAPIDSGTLPHNHGDAFNHLAFGKKSWVLFDADQSKEAKGYDLLMKFNRNYPVGSHSKDWFKKEVPKLGKSISSYYHFTQEPGDIVYIPHRYAHAVLNFSEVMGIVIETKRYESK